MNVSKRCRKQLISSYKIHLNSPYNRAHFWWTSTQKLRAPHWLPIAIICSLWIIKFPLYSIFRPSVQISSRFFPFISPYIHMKEKQAVHKQRSNRRREEAFWAADACFFRKKALFANGGRGLKKGRSRLTVPWKSAKVDDA